MDWREDILARFPDWGTDTATTRWQTTRAAPRVGQSVRGIVIGRAPFGVWLDIGAEHPALLLVPEMRGGKERPISFEEYPAKGEILEARIISLGPRAEISLTQHPEEVPQSEML